MMPRKHDSEPPRSSVSRKDHNEPGSIGSLPIGQWPAADRAAWANACRPMNRLKRGGSAAHLRVITRDDLCRRYGYFMDFIRRTEGLDPNAAVVSYVTPDRVARYEAELEKRVSSVTVHGSIYKLRRMAQILNPSAELGWLNDLENDLALLMRPRPKSGRVVYSHILLRAGLTLMTEAHYVMKQTPLRRARQFRNGLMVALLACHPMRLKNFAALELGRTLPKIEKNWWIVLPTAETKEKRQDERKIDPFLAPYLELYLEKYRPVLACEGRNLKLLWASSHGRSMTYKAIERAIKQTTLASIGVDVCPHLFRTAGASTVAVSAPEMPGLGAALLHHHDRRVTEERYNWVETVGAARSFGALIRRFSARD